MSIINTTKKNQEAVLFGFSKNYNKLDENFGSEKGLIIKPTVSNVEYQQLLVETLIKKINIKKIVIQCENNIKQLTQVITIQSNEAKGITCKTPLILPKLTKQYRSQKRNEIEFNVLVDACTSLHLTILPEARLILSIFEETPNTRISTTINIIPPTLNPKL